MSRKERKERAAQKINRVETALILSIGSLRKEEGIEKLRNVDMFREEFLQEIPGYVPWLKPNESNIARAAAQRLFEAIEETKRVHGERWPEIMWIVDSEVHKRYESGYYDSEKGEEDVSKSRKS